MYNTHIYYMYNTHIYIICTIYNIHDLYYVCMYHTHIHCMYNI